MSEEPKGPGAGSIVAGIFLCLAGTCLVLVGGACAGAWLAVGMGGNGSIGPLLFLLSVGILIGGVLVVRAGVKAFRGPPTPHGD